MFKWKLEHIIKLPKRKVSKFLFFPKIINGKIKWLKKCQWIEFKTSKANYYIIGPNSKDKWSYLVPIREGYDIEKWFPICWVD